MSVHPRRLFISGGLRILAFLDMLREMLMRPMLRNLPVRHQVAKHHPLQPMSSPLPLPPPPPPPPLPPPLGPLSQLLSSHWPPWARLPLPPIFHFLLRRLTSCDASTCAF